MSIKTETRDARDTAQYAFEGAIDKYKDRLKLILQLEMENLYGSEDRDEFPGRGELFNQAIEECIKIIQSL